jgi:hypothetical protein
MDADTSKRDSHDSVHWRVFFLYRASQGQWTIGPPQQIRVPKKRVDLGSLRSRKVWSFARSLAYVYK